MCDQPLPILLAICACLGIGGCRPSGKANQSLEVFAAASLTESFTEIGAAFEAEHPGVHVRFNFGGSQQLRAQLENAAVADVFASANPKEMDAADLAGLIDSSTIKTFAHNQLVVIVSRKDSAPPASFEDLAKKGLRLDVADPSVPVGKYTVEMLDRVAKDPRFGEAFRNGVLANVVSREENVKSVVNKVRLGEVEAGVVYFSDAASASDLETLRVPPQFNPRADYPLGVVRRSTSPALAATFVSFILSPTGQDCLVRHGLIGNRRDDSADTGG